ncbi:amino acid adenylation domain-containing protein [Umezawaea sp. NPDC059074]|uniref:non-ribosomal peptide synthetase n=1 Tax=Umezawaea sp. NPDC059074 TaxID=3346716 RepID=UPI0036BDD732
MSIDHCVPRAVAHRAAEAAGAVAVELDGVGITYAELELRSAAAAEQLLSAGVRPGDVVGVLTGGGLDMVPALLGVLRTGAAYLPLDARHSRAQIAELLRLARSEFVIATSDVDDDLAPANATTVRPVWDGPTSQGSPVAVVAPEDLAYAIFTSGSTGEPKCVAVPHRALANHASAMSKRYSLGPADRVLQFANIGFDVAAEEIFPTLVSGGCVVLCPTPPPPEKLAEALDRAGVTVVNLPSGYWQRWVATLATADRVEVPALRLVVIGSEGVDPAAVTAWRRTVGLPLVNAYGLTETTITSMAYAVEDADLDGGVVPVGLPIDGVTAHVLDPEGRPVPVGVEGELHIGGACVALGYLHRPDLTAERFLPDPFSDVVGAVVHRTGDRARVRADGNVEVLGRLDDQFKVNGYRVEPAHVQSALSTHPLVVESVVRPRTGPGGTVRLVGYVVLRGGVLDVPSGLRSHLVDRLPVHLVPDVFVALPRMPVTANGKLDHAALPEPPAVQRRATVGAARTAVESRLLEIWREVLGSDEFGVHDNFFDVGGDSAKLLVVMSRLGEVNAHGVGLVALFEHPTIASLATRLTRSSSAPSSDRRPGATPRRRRVTR